MIAWAYPGEDGKRSLAPAWVKTLQASEAWGTPPWEITGEKGLLAKKRWIERNYLYQFHLRQAQTLEMRKQWPTILK